MLLRAHKFMYKFSSKKNLNLVISCMFLLVQAYDIFQTWFSSEAYVGQTFPYVLWKKYNIILQLLYVFMLLAFIHACQNCFLTGQNTEGIFQFLRAIMKKTQSPSAELKGIFLFRFYNFMKRHLCIYNNFCCSLFFKPLDKLIINGLEIHGASS